MIIYKRRDFLKYTAMSSLAISLPLPKLKGMDQPITKKALVYGMTS